MRYLGDFPVGGVVYFSFSTQKADGTPATLTDGVLAVRKNATAAALTLDPVPVLAVDFNSVTGLNNVTVDLADADFVAGDYDVCLSAGTVDSVSVVGRVLAHFSIENRFMRGTDDAALAATALDNTVWTDEKAAFVDASIAAIPTGDTFSALPANFSDLAIAVTTGEVTAGNMVDISDLALETTVGGVAAATSALIAALATADGTTGTWLKAMHELEQRSAGKLVIDRALGTIKVYDTNGSSLLFTLTKATDGDIDTITRS